MLLLEYKSDRVTILLKPTKGFQFTYSKTQSPYKAIPSLPSPHLLTHLTLSYYFLLYCLCCSHTSLLGVLWTHQDFPTLGFMYIPRLLQSFPISAWLTLCLLQVFTGSSSSATLPDHFVLNANSCLNTPLSFFLPYFAPSCLPLISKPYLFRLLSVSPH